jgi:lysophospholipase-2
MSSTNVAPISGTHTHTIIFLHGRNSFGEDLSQDFFDSKSANDGTTLAAIFPTVKFVFPTFRLRDSSRVIHDSPSFAHLINPMSQWFDIWSVENHNEKPELMCEGLRESVTDILDIIRQEAKLVPLDNIILGGISQGCAIAVMTLLSCNLRIGGVMGICGWMPFQGEIAHIAKSSTGSAIAQQVRSILDNTEPVPVDVQSPEIAQTKIFLAHSMDDETVPSSHGVGLKTTLEYLGYEVAWTLYEDGGHWIHPSHGVDDLAKFLDVIIGG